MHKCQGRIDRIIHQQIGRVDPYFLQCVVQKHSKLILSDLSEKCRSLSKFVQHCQHIAWRASRARLKQIVSLFAFSIHCKINEKFSHCDHIIFLFPIPTLLLLFSHILTHTDNFLIKIHQFFDLISAFYMLRLQNRSGSMVHRQFGVFDLCPDLHPLPGF